MERELIFSGSAGTGYGGREKAGGNGNDGVRDTGGQGRVRGYGL